MPREPIIVDAKGDVEVFGSLAAAEAALEPIDVANEEYKIFDADGLLLAATIAIDGIHVRIVESSPPDRQPEELVSVLRRFVSRLGNDLTGIAEEEIWRAPLVKLIDVIAGLEPYRRRRRSFWRPWRRDPLTSRR
jgi:hypothetical protein